MGGAKAKEGRPLNSFTPLAISSGDARSRNVQLNQWTWLKKKKKPGIARHANINPMD